MTVVGIQVFGEIHISIDNNNIIIIFESLAQSNPRARGHVLKSLIPTFGACALVNSNESKWSKESVGRSVGRSQSKLRILYTYYRA
jgi:hypothetical protein